MSPGGQKLRCVRALRGSKTRGVPLGRKGHSQNQRGPAWTLSIPSTPCDRQGGQRRTTVPPRKALHVAPSLGVGENCSSYCFEHERDTNELCISGGETHVCQPSEGNRKFARSVLTTSSWFDTAPCSPSPSRFQRLKTWNFVPLQLSWTLQL